MATRYIPDSGDVIGLHFTPQPGHEQAGHRPALVLSPQFYNARVGLAIVCPITSSTKGYPFEVQLPPKFPVKGAVLSDQLKSIDWKIRGAAFIDSVPAHVLVDVRTRVAALIG